ncbi:PTS sugar transporter subunit IIA [Natranaerobius thermophilus]|uniref:PTS system, glucose subfamily, IIA subunit n=1 Tax=Natranaerobius thermophilus (strain ATCC BAA-1301 / DSM 18059 / JW/NM-WN-LF) TaxID=457570 RepID=B2A2V5_NATTJ|nr:PTS glucose transporter subunit IIA [Natranaerobius thermophilus]ACB86323.1 PTS system, glucose subfamily, IIA subunit [Natranaerobius thermophilus JW/NM-WN-LF]
MVASSKWTEIKAPFSGKVVDLNEVEDPKFAQGEAGKGAAITPSEETDGILVSPVKGKITKTFDTNHGIGLATEDGLEILINIGSETVQLEGYGFEGLVEEGEQVDESQPLIKFDHQIIKQAGKSLVTPVVITDSNRIEEVEYNSGNETEAGDVLFKAKITG